MKTTLTAVKSSSPRTVSAGIEREAHALLSKYAKTTADSGLAEFTQARLLKTLEFGTRRLDETEAAPRIYRGDKVRVSLKFNSLAFDALEMLAKRNGFIQPGRFLTWFILAQLLPEAERWSDSEGTPAGRLLFCAPETATLTADQWYEQCKSNFTIRRMTLPVVVDSADASESAITPSPF